MIAGVAASKPFLITVSALAAIVCWSALVASDGTLTRQKVFANVAVSVTGDAALKSRGYIVMDDILEEVPARQNDGRGYAVQLQPRQRHVV